MLVPLKGAWALIFGVSSGMGKAVALALADEGCNVIGVHFDLSAGQAQASALAAELRSRGVEARFLNRNLVSAEARSEVLELIREVTGDSGIRVLLHSVAFGTLLPFFPDTDGGGKYVTLKQLTMTVDVMAHSLVYWTQDLIAAGLLGPGAKIFGMTSSGGTRVLPNYGAVSAAKAALEAHCRQLAVELAPKGIAVNAIRAGTTITPALQKIPGSDGVIERCQELNPHGRLTRVEDVAEAIVQLSMSDSSWITGNVIGVDGGEALVA
ncbi:enoyl-ACP reductase [Streptosporangium sp. NPDC000396]|uniref:enoyl-ACP reductase FabI n=1 Tax=Streptosporangium sp. NPDC000396 TaxID=3366185 RepID=UPI0036782260